MVSRLRQGAAESVKSPHHQHVTAAGVVEESREFGAVVASTRHRFSPDPFCASMFEGHHLHLGGLMQDRDAGVSEDRHRRTFLVLAAEGGPELGSSTSSRNPARKARTKAS